MDRESRREGNQEGSDHRINSRNVTQDRDEQIYRIYTKEGVDLGIVLPT